MLSGLFANYVEYGYRNKLVCILHIIYKPTSFTYHRTLIFTCLTVTVCPDTYIAMHGPSVPARHISEDAAPCPYRIVPRPNSLVHCLIYITPCPMQKNFLTYNLCFCVFRQLMYNACCIFVPMFSSIGHKIVPRSCFVRVLDCARILVVHALNCARFCCHLAH